VTRGFEAFRRGTFGNAGQNLYVSRAGVLQRIHQYDINRDGYVDLLFCNSQNHWEIPPAYLYRWRLVPSGDGEFIRDEVPGLGANCATVADLNGDGREELIIGRHYDGAGFDVNAIIYYGSAGQWGEQAVQYLPVPSCRAVAAGDFNGDGRMDLAFQCQQRLRIFYQTDLAFEPKRFVDLDIQGEQLAAADLDGDGFSELITRAGNGVVRVYWGGPAGIEPQHFTEVTLPGESAGTVADAGAPAMPTGVEWVGDVLPLVKVIRLGGRPLVFVARRDAAWLVPFPAGRSAGSPQRFDCLDAVSVAVGDLDCDGYDDVAFACRDRRTGNELSWVYWGAADGFSADRRTAVASACASDVAIGDLDGDGRAEIAIASAYTQDAFSVSSPVYRFRQREARLWQSLESHDARRVFAVGPRPGEGSGLLIINRQGRNKLGNVDVSIYLGGPEGFSPERRIGLPGFGAVLGICADFNDDGLVDMALCNAAENAVDRDPGSYVYLNTPHGFPDRPSQLLPTKCTHGIACADINRDGFLELITTSFNHSELLIFSGTPQGFDTAHPQRLRLELDGQEYKECCFICLADWNGDGWLDLFIPMIGCEHSLLLWGGPEGFSMQRSRKLSVWHAASARAADLDGDGYLDLIVGGHTASPSGPHDSFAYIYWNGPDGLREDRRTLLPGEAINSISVADFNNDGNLDLFINSYQDGRKRRDLDCYIYWNRGGRGFSARDFTRLFNHSASGDFAADFDEDGWIDLAVASHKVYGDHKGESKVWWNGPGGFSEQRVTWLPSEGPHGMATPGPGNVMDRGPEEYYVSEPYRLSPGATVQGIAWDADLGPKTWVRAQLRFAQGEEALASAPWLGPAGAGSWFENDAGVSDPAAVGQWLQYRLALGAVNSGCTPRVTAVTVTLGIREVSG
jgi:hypothetical protein